MGRQQQKTGADAGRAGQCQNPVRGERNRESQTEGTSLKT